MNNLFKKSAVFLLCFIFIGFLPLIAKAEVPAVNRSYYDIPSDISHWVGARYLKSHPGPELVPGDGTFTGAATGWTLGTGWAYSSNTVVKNGDGTGTLSPTTALTITANSIYRVAYTISSMTVSSVTASMGGVTFPIQSDNDSLAIFYITASSTANLVFTPANTSRFTIDNISVKKVGTAGTDTVVLFEDDRDSVAGGGSLFSLGESGGHSIRIGNTGIGLGDSANVNHQNAGVANYEYGSLGKINSGAGGLDVSGYTDADGTALALNCYVGSEDPTDTTPICKVVASKKSGTTTQALGSGETVFQILNRTTELFTQTGDGSYRQPASTYHNFGATIGTGGYGIYDNAGTLQFKNSGGAWADLVSAVSAGGWQDDGGIVRLITGADNVGMGGATAGGTNLAGGLVWGNGTAPTTYPANASQFWMADEGSRGGYSHPHFANEAGQNGAIAFQSPLVNLLSNSGFGVWSNGTLENVGSQLVASWTNADYDTFTSAGADITSAVYTTAGTQDASSAAITLVSGKLYKIVVTLTLNSGQAPTLAMTNLGHTSAAISAGANTFVREATDTTTTLTVSNTAAANWSATFTLYEVTPGCVAADTLGPDGWNKNSSINMKWYRQHNDGGTLTKEGSFYGLKGITANAAAVTNYLQWPATPQQIDPLILRLFAGRTVSYGVWVKTSTASSVKLSIYDGTEYFSSYHSGDGTWKWLETSATINSSVADFRIFIYLEQIDTVYISQPMLVFGPSIGAGNYAPSPNETIYTEKVIALTDYTATTSAADGTINPETQSSGMIPKGVKAVLVKAYGKDSAAGDGVGFDVQSASGVEDGLSIDTQVNNVRVQGVGWVKADSNGDIVFDHRGSGASALTVDLKVIGVQP